ncbi:hypothetical protein [Falsiroseomonas sp.]|uniref:hypothetical protein n=1 Tax=Falsiroseomonas sp. TaxID=2870721 RepID=UPI0027233085|nr:hypothetical protein [Falsiroseomonas sp.]MDO9500093.1 hypothetical protein [Falsiroseomonas sp.]
MRYAGRLAGAALVLAAMTAGSAAQAQSGHEWQGQDRQFLPSAVASCTLRLDRIYQPNAGQPIHLVITNATQNRLRYDVQMVLRRGSEFVVASIHVDNANPGEQTTRPFTQALPGSLAGSVVFLQITSCTIRS